jgi:molybdopterin molybdotransferase
MLEVEDARRRVLAAVTPLDIVRVPIVDAIGSALASDAVAPHDLPRFANSGMDGFALRGAEGAAATEDAPIELRIVGEVRAGGPAGAEVAPGTAVRIMTGAALPPGADAVIQVEATESRGENVLLRAPTPAGTHVRPAGDDVKAGDVVVPSGIEIGPGEAALLSSLGLSPVDVHRRPRVALLVTGDELVDPEEDPAPNQIRDSNTVALRSLVAESGGEIVAYERVSDTHADHLAAFERAIPRADLILSSGGVAVGEYDHVKNVVQSLGSIDLWRVAMQPGKPVVLGEVGGVPFLGLPGNPVSVHVGFEQFVRPALRKMRGCRYLLRPTITAALTEPLSKRPGRLHFVRVRLEFDGAVWQATPTGAQGSHIQSSLVDCHGVARFDRDLTELPSGHEVVVEVWKLPSR